MSSLCDSLAHQIDQLSIINGLEPLNKPTGPVCVCVYHRVKINGRMYFSLNYKRVKKCNSYTVAFKDYLVTDASLCYGEIKEFMQVSTNSPPLAIVKCLITQISGPPHHLSASVITADSKELLFDSYLIQKDLSGAYLSIV